MIYSTLLILSLLPLGDAQGVLSRDLAPLEPKALPVERISSFDLAAEKEDATYLLIVGSPSRGERAELTVTVTSIDKAQPLPVLLKRTDPQWLQRATAVKREMAAQRQRPRPEPQTHVAAKFREQRSFHLFVREDDFLDRNSYQQVVADLVHVGSHCLIYVDVDDLEMGFPTPVAAEVAEIFDEHVLPNARQLYGRHLDIDRDGKFAILFTHWLANLSNGKVSIGGFVRGSDFLADLAPPFSNQCDMMYLNSNLRPGDHLRTLIAHEYTHAVTFSEHTYGEYLTGHFGEDEETWLSEAMAHLAENFIGSGWSNLDYRISAYLNAPNRYQLVVPDYYRAGLWRCHGSRGATYLFLRWCVDRYGAELLQELSRSNLQGVANLEAATLTPFDELFRAWSIATCLSGIAPGVDETHGFRSIDLRDRLETRVLTGPRFQELRPGPLATALEPTSWQPFVVRVPQKQALRIRFDSEKLAELQATLIRLPDPMPVVQLTADSTASQSNQIRIKQSGGPAVHWTKLTIEPESLPQTKKGGAAPDVAIVDLERSLPKTSTAPGSDLLCPPLAIPSSSEPQVVKVLGIDALGRKVTAWLTVEGTPDVESTAANPAPSLVR